jgi:HAD superfamily hydrolase (TIGR01509 family)
VIRGIIFDCFGVLCHGSLDYLRSIVPPEHLQELNDLSHSSDYGYLSEKEYVDKVGILLDRPGSEVRDIIQAQCIRNEDVIALATRLHGEYKIALLSNVGRGRINTLFTPDELTELFDTVILSSEVGMVKPDADIYHLAAAKLGLEPSECIMIDDILRNVDGAKAIGMHGLVCASARQCEADLMSLLEAGRA